MNDSAVGDRHKENRDNEERQVEEHGVGLQKGRIWPTLPARMGAARQVPVLLKNGHGRHGDESEEPAHPYRAVRVRQGLPGAGVERLADGVVSLHGNCNQSEATHAH